MGSCWNWAYRIKTSSPTLGHKMNCSDDKKTVTVDITKVISKSILYLCLTSMFGMLVYTCKVDTLVIDKCKSACGTYNGVKQVTSRKCVCNNEKTIAESYINPWLLPR